MVCIDKEIEKTYLLKLKKIEEINQRIKENEIENIGVDENEKTAEKRIKLEYERKELYDEINIIEKYIKKIEYIKKVKEKYENSSRRS